VISRGSVTPYRNPDTTIAEVRDTLGAGWILRGEIQQAGDRVRVHARLVNTQKDRQVWADAFERRLTTGSLFDIQREITGHVVEATKTRLRPRDPEEAHEAGTASLEAYRPQVQGRGLLGPRTEPSMRRAVEHFERALELDPEYAVAWAGLADALTYLETFGHPLPSAATDPTRAAERALELDPELAEAHFALANLAHAERRNPEAMSRLERSVELQPSYADAHNLTSWIHRLDGHPEASFRSAVRANELDPLGSAPRSNVALGHLVAGRHNDAVESARRLRSLAPDFTTGPFLEALAHHHRARSTEVTSLLDGLVVPWADDGPRATRAVALVAAGESEAARDELAKIDRTDDIFSSALVRAALGEPDEAVERLKRIERWSYWATLAMRYLFPEVLGPIRSEPGYEGILRSIDRSWGIGKA